MSQADVSLLCIYGMTFCNGIHFQFCSPYLMPEFAWRH